MHVILSTRSGPLTKGCGAVNVVCDKISWSKKGPVILVLNLFINIELVIIGSIEPVIWFRRTGYIG